MKNDDDKQKVDSALAVRMLKENMCAVEEHTRLLAHIVHVRYLALIEEGFSVEQALLLCRE